MSADLKPCPVPWCRNHTAPSNDDPPIIEPVGDIGYQVLCPECGCHGFFKKIKAEAISAWNTRPSDSVLVAARKVADAVRVFDSERSLSVIGAMENRNAVILASRALAALLPAERAEKETK